jgi:hypothetical protein
MHWENNDPEQPDSGTQTARNLMTRFVGVHVCRCIRELNTTRSADDMRRNNNNNNNNKKVQERTQAAAA